MCNVYIIPQVYYLFLWFTKVEIKLMHTIWWEILYLFQNVIPIEKQLEYLRECRKRLEDALGKRRIENHVKNAAFFISAGTNDFVLNYFAIPARRKSYSILAYQQFLIQHVREFIQVCFNYVLPRYKLIISKFSFHASSIYVWIFLRVYVAIMKPYIKWLFLLYTLPDSK